jgi:autotransporter-associated beta strand protein
LLSLAALAIPLTAAAQLYTPGQSYFGRSNYVEYIAGDLPITISAPHGGALTPAEIPDRVDDGSDPNFTTVTDSNTDETARALQSVFEITFGHSPHVIICRLKRTKLDCNRSVDQGVYNTNTFATQAWNEFQNYISVGTNASVIQCGRGFYLDQHGQGHTIQRLELGYLLSSSQLMNSDSTLNSTVYRNQSSIRPLATLVSNQFAIPFSQILRGSNSFGALMVARGYPSVPSPDMPDPGTGNAYFDGGYNVGSHTSQSSGGVMDGLQIEANFTNVRDTAANRAAYALAVAQSLEFIFTNCYKIDLRLVAPCKWSIGSGKWATTNNWGGILPVSGNYLLFAGAGGAVSNNLAALTTGTGKIYSLLYATNASGSYTNYGNAISLLAGITNFSGFAQTVSNHVTLLAAQTFSASNAPLNFFGNVTNGGFRLFVDAATNIVFNSAISGLGGLTKSGTGTLTLNAASTFTGPTTNQTGLLLMNNPNGSANGAGALFVNANATLGGTGTVSGPVVISGSLAPGNYVGALAITNGLQFTNGGKYLWALAANSTNSPGVNFDQIVLTGGSLILHSNASLVIAFTNSATAPATNNVFWQSPQAWKIISLGAAATNLGLAKFNVITSNNFNAGKFVSSADGAGNVFLNFLPTPPPVITPALPGAGTTNLTISWTAVTGVTYQVQFATNLASPNWQPLGNVTASTTNASLIDTSPVAPQRFYRIAIP